MLCDFDRENVCVIKLWWVRETELSAFCGGKGKMREVEVEGERECHHVIQCICVMDYFLRYKLLIDDGILVTCVQLFSSDVVNITSTDSGRRFHPLMARWSEVPFWQVTPGLIALCSP